MHPLLLAGLGQAVRRVRWRRCVRESGWAGGALSALLGIHLLLAACGAPASVLAAIRPLLGMAALAILVVAAWRITRRTDPSAVAAELDARVGLADELKSACWFAAHGGNTAWEALLLDRAIRTLRGIDVAAALPVRASGVPVHAAGAGALLLLLGLVAGPVRDHVADDPGGDAVVITDPNTSPRPGAAPAVDHIRDDPTSPDAASAAEARRTERRVEQGGGVPGEAQTGAAGSPPDPTSAAATADPAQALSPGGARTGVGAGAAARSAAAAATELARDLIGKLTSMLGVGSPHVDRAELGGELQSGLADGHPDKARHDAAQEHTTTDPFAEVPRGLAQTPDGDRPMLGAAPGSSSQGGGRTTITGGSNGMRVNISEQGDDGTDTPPDAPLAEPESLMGRKTERLGAKLDRIATDPVGVQSGGESEGFYAVSQAQAARVEFGSGAGTARATRETALSGGQVPMAYRGVVKRYFVNEHGRER
jgi:hypothetical protein